ncbi:MAG TPA: amino acid ABC transporter substrate-binding protein [Xanthobacteraceae bacterium]|nr:amino acid ABC transporter substrate-binding protein [Xanthobacteraceae bacterium]
MPRNLQLKISALLAGAALALVLPLTGPAKAADPIKIGFSMALTGPLSANGKQALLGMQIWEEEINAKGGLLGRPVKLIYYDDQSTAKEAPGIYTKLLDVDKVDLIIGPYATVPAAAAMTVAVQRKKVFEILFGLDVNHEFKYDRFFAMIPSGPDTKPAFTEGFFTTAMAQNPKPQTVALAFADAEFGQNACEGARQNAKKDGLKIVYDKSYPPSTTDFTPIVRAVQATNPDLFVVCSYPLDSVGMVKAVNEVGFKPKMAGGAMVGLQATVFKNQLGPLLNGWVNYETWVPSDKMMLPSTAEFLKKYQAKAGAAGVDPLGYYLGTWGYAYIQVYEQAINATKSLDDGKLAEYMHKATFKTINGDIKFGPGGEWEKSGMLQVQYHGIKQGAGLDVWRGMSYQTVLTPAGLKTGNVIYPFEKARE